MGASLGAVAVLASTVAREAAKVAAAAATPRVAVTPATPRVAVTPASAGAPDGRAHVAVRGVHQRRSQEAVRRLERLLVEQPGVHAAETNAVLGRVLVRYDPAVWDAASLGRLVADAERECGLAGEPWAPSAHAHPAHPGALVRSALRLGLNVAGLGYATLARAVPVPPLGVLPTALALADVVPRLRAILESAVGRPTADTALAVASAVANTATRQPLALVAGACHGYTLYQEAAARRRAWQQWDGMLAGRDGAHRCEPRPVPPRPVPLPGGPVERTAHLSAALGLGGAGMAAALARPRAAALLAAGVPKATRAAREGFAAQLDQDLCAAGCLVLDPWVLRRLDRVDGVLLDTALLRSGRHVIEDVVPLARDADPGELSARAHDLVDPQRPGHRRHEDGWSVAPVTTPARAAPSGAPSASATGLPPDVRRLALEHGERGRTVLVLRHQTTPVALVVIAAELDAMAEPVAAAAGAALGAAAVYVVDTRGAAGRRRLLKAVRLLQRQGRVVALVSRDDVATAAADVGIGLIGARGAPPWGAHVLCRSPAQVCRLLDAAALARRASRYGARLSVAGSAFGALLAALGPARGAPSRAAIPVQCAALLAFGVGLWAALAAARRPDPVPTQRTPWHAMSPEAVLTLLGSSAQGLSTAESERRRRAQPEDHVDADVGLARATVEEMATPLTPALAAGAGLSAAVGSALDALLIVAVLVLNALIGGVQRVGAQRELHRLTARSSPLVRVRRAGGPRTGGHREDGQRADGQRADGRRVIGERTSDLRAEELVPGEVIELHAGDAVPADCRLIAALGLEVDESSLTGESAPVPKTTSATAAAAVADRTCMLYEGTVVASGRAVGVVVATGASTEVGRTQRISEGGAPEGGVEARLRALTGRILPYSAGAGLALAGVDLLRRRGLGQALGRAVGLAVAAVPEGLPFVATVAELAAARRLSARGALVRNPGIIEALGRVDVLCFDKTGTLTEGRLRLRQVSDGTRAAPLDELTGPLREVLAAAVRASPFAADQRQVPHQTDRAVLRDAARLGVTVEHDQEPVEYLHELAFESGRGYHATLWRGRDGTHVSVKGAPEVVLPLADRWRRGGRGGRLDEQARRRIGAEVERLARSGFRVLAVAERSLPGGPGAGRPGPERAMDEARGMPGQPGLSEEEVTGLELRGLLALADAVRPTAAQAVTTLRAAGVAVVMITGDHPSTAESIAAELDLLDGRDVLPGTELDALDDAQLERRLPQVAVFARVSPEQKARIVRRLRAAGRAVAVTGDGANDAPAIRLADVGLALGAHATPAARQAADVVIVDDSIETITDAIVEGRAMWASVRDALSVLLGGNLGEIAYTVGTGLFSGAAALNARQLLLVNMLTDVLPAMAVAVRPPPGVTPEELLAEGPDASLGAALNRDIGLRAAITAVSALVAWLAARPVSTPGQAATTGLVALVGAQLGQTIVVRGRTPLVVAAAAGSLALLAAVVQVPAVSRVAGCRPLLPHQWGIALTAATAAAAAQLVAPAALRVVTAWLPVVHLPLAWRSPSPV